MRVLTAAQIGTTFGLALLFSISCSTEPAHEPRGALSSAELLDAHHADELFVAVGTNDPGSDPYDLESYVLSSTDGVHWEERYRAPGTILYAVAHGAGRWVAVGWAFVDDEQRIAELLTSEDGLIWSVQPELGVEFLMDVVWTGEAFVLAAGRTSSELVTFTSTDGVDWVEGASLPGDVGSRLVASEGTVVAWGSAVSVSPDHGQTWSSAAGLTQGTWVTGLSVDGTQFYGSSVLDCCFGEVPEKIEHYAISSDDGHTFTETQLEPEEVIPLGVVASNSVEVGYDGGHLYFRESGGAWEIGARGSFSDVTHAQGAFVAVGPSTLKWSRDGKAWEDGVLSGD